jgi:hypothetical protein
MAFDNRPCGFPLRTVQVAFFAYAFPTDTFCVVRLRLERILSAEEEPRLRRHFINSLGHYDRSSSRLLGLRNRQANTPVLLTELRSHTYPCILSGAER